MVVELRRLCATDLSYGDIGKRMGLTKNSVIAKARRLKIDAERPDFVRLRNSSGGWNRFHQRIKAASMLVLQPRTEKSDTLPPGGCLFPMWDHQERPTHVYCGEQRREGAPYCRHHCEIAYKSKDEMQEAA